MMADRTKGMGERASPMLLTDRRQQQAIRDRMYGHTNGLKPDDLNPPYDYLWEVVKDCHDPQDAYHQLLRARTTYDDLKDIVDSILSMEPGHSQRYESLDDIGPTLPGVDWLWPHWIPRGLLTMLASDPGVGKTNIALDLAMRVIHAKPAPDGEPLDIRTKNIIYVDAEDFLPVIYERATAWQMNLSRFYPVRRPERDLLDMIKKKNQDTLLDMCYDLRPDLVVVDSLSSVNLRSENNIEDLREILSFFVELPREFKCAVLLVHHLRKSQKGQSYNVTMHDLRGSGHITAMARSILGLYTPGDDPNGPRRLRVIKTNLCKHPRPLSIRYVKSPANPDVAMVSYDHISNPTIPENLTGDCTEWLEETLAANGAMSYSDLVEAADQAGYKENTLQNARKALDWKVIDTVGPKRRGNRWALHSYNGEESEAETALDENGRTCEEIITWSHGHVIHTPPKKSPPPLSHGHVTMRHMSSWRPKTPRNGHHVTKHPLFRAIDTPRTVHYPPVGPLPAKYPYPRRQAGRLNGHKRR